MTTFKLEEIPVKDLQALGLHDGSKLLLDGKNKETLLGGGLTSFVHLQNLKIEGAENTSLDAKLSLRRKADGSAGLFVHPIYREKMAHPALSPEEDGAFSRGGPFARKEAAFGKIAAFGDAPYQFDEKNAPSFYIELEKRNGEKARIWGIDLKRALQESGHHVGDEVQLFLKGRENVRVQVPVRDEHENVIGSKWETTNRLNWEIGEFIDKNKREKTVIYEFDRDTNSFVSVDENQVNVPEEINGVPLSSRQKKRYKEGEEVTVDDGTKIQVSPASESSLRANRNLFILSLMVDGGLSYALYKGVDALFKAGEKQKQEENIYSKGYLDALHKVERNLEQRQAEFPDDKEISRELVFLKEEIRHAAGTPGPKISEAKANAHSSEPENTAQQHRDSSEEKDGIDKSSIHLNRTETAYNPMEPREEIHTTVKR
jgi:hypothetical protein